MIFFTTLFYLFGICMILLEIWMYYNSDFVMNYKIKMNKYIKDNTIRITESEYVYSLIHTLYVIWFLIGSIFTFQWVFFLSFGIISVIPNKTEQSNKLRSILSIIFLMLLLLNKYQFHYMIF